MSEELYGGRHLMTLYGGHQIKLENLQLQEYLPSELTYIDNYWKTMNKIMQPARTLQKAPNKKILKLNEYKMTFVTDIVISTPNTPFYIGIFGDKVRETSFIKRLRFQTPGSILVLQLPIKLLIKI